MNDCNLRQSVKIELNLCDMNVSQASFRNRNSHLHNARFPRLEHFQFTECLKTALGSETEVIVIRVEKVRISILLLHYYVLE